MLIKSLLNEVRAHISARSPRALSGTTLRLVFRQFFQSVFTLRWADDIISCKLSRCQLSSEPRYLGSPRQRPSWTLGSVSKYSPNPHREQFMQIDRYEGRVSSHDWNHGSSIDIIRNGIWTRYVKGGGLVSAPYHRITSQRPCTSRRSSNRYYRE